ncbi:MAG: hypothetical protein E6J13_15650 [Chloroflexi bacterium]|nr:MAG: hypothetical protein E6J13_15650 [Chloroflexota bacterium]
MTEIELGPLTTRLEAATPLTVALTASPGWMVVVRATMPDGSRADSSTVVRRIDTTAAAPADGR